MLQDLWTKLVWANILAECIVTTRSQDPILPNGLMDDYGARIPMSYTTLPPFLLILINFPFVKKIFI